MELIGSENVIVVRTSGISCFMFCLLRGVRIVVRLSLRNLSVRYPSAFIDPDAEIETVDGVVESSG